jgi:ParB/RepB/Spo0J family partition protein
VRGAISDGRPYRDSYLQVFLWSDVPNSCPKKGKKMSNTLSANHVDPAFRAVSCVQDIPLDRIRESNSNPRRIFDETKLRELAENIKLHGVLQSILVRPIPDGADGNYELVAGARRFRASKLAGKDTIPATVRDLTDAECREIQLIENLQRTDIHELDEGIGYRSLMDLKPDFYTVETIAVQVAKSPSYVKGRISLADLIPAAQTAFYEGKLTVAHALELARLQPADQSCRESGKAPTETKEPKARSDVQNEQVRTRRERGLGLSDPGPLSVSQRSAHPLCVCLSFLFHSNRLRTVEQFSSSVHSRVVNT